ncbi:sigma-E factor negative regulatory protein RseB [Actimicrobium sp. GrIS 1.19]|nr:sigma-E factor negative regulatory protein RseB [Actimicrobium sp. GrIS 1.19]
MTFMRQTLASLKFVVVLSSLISYSALAEGVDSQDENRDAQNWLRRIQVAAQKVNYWGTFVYQQANQVRTSRITHIHDGKNEMEKLEILDGKPREYIRNNDEVVCYVPEIHTLFIEKRPAPEVFPAILATNPADVTLHYTVKRGESGRVAGYDTQALLLEPKDNLRYGYKLWAEKATGLLLRAQTLNDKQEVIEQIAFTQLEIGNINRSRVKPSFTNTAGWHTENSVMSPVTVQSWTVKSIPAGFKKIREMKRLISDSAPQGESNGSAPVQRELIQLVFSDGLAAISVFIEPGSRSRTEGSMQQGAVNITGKRQGDFWLTIVGEVPEAAIKQVANSIEFKPK